MQSRFLHLFLNPNPNPNPNEMISEGQWRAVCLFSIGDRAVTKTPLHGAYLLGEETNANKKPTEINAMGKNLN